MRWLRSTLRDQGRENELIIDLLVDDDFRVCERYSYFGIWRENNENYPFTLHSFESAMDFGVLAGAPRDRYGSLKLHGHIVHEGCVFVYESIARNYDLQLEQTKDLTE